MNLGKQMTDWQEKIQDRKNYELSLREDAEYAATQYGSIEGGATSIEDIVSAMIEKGSMSSQWYKHQVAWNFDKFETISEVVNDCCISLGIGEEDYSPWISHKQSDQIQIFLQ